MAIYVNANFVPEYFSHNRKWAGDDNESPFEH